MTNHPLAYRSHALSNGHRPAYLRGIACSLWIEALGRRGALQERGSRHVRG